MNVCWWPHEDGGPVAGLAGSQRWPGDRGRVSAWVDFGSPNTVAVRAGPDGVVRPLLFDGAPTRPSAVCAQPDGTLWVGSGCVH